MISEFDRTTVRRLQTMMDASLITYQDLQSWAQSMLSSMEKPPIWLSKVATQTCWPDVSKSLGEYLWSELFEAADRADVDDEHLGSLYLRFARHELTWTSFLVLAGEYAERADGAWVYEEFFRMLDELEDADFSPAIARAQQVRTEHRLGAAIGRIRFLYEQVHVRRQRGQ